MEQWPDSADLRFRKKKAVAELYPRKLDLSTCDCRLQVIARWCLGSTSTSCSSYLERAEVVRILQQLLSSFYFLIIGSFLVSHEFAVVIFLSCHLI